jgi:DNA-binding LytR/AlgR family response regulator
VSVSIAVCEDEPNIRKEIAALITSHSGDYSLACYSSADALLNTGEEYDIYILDIQMPGMSGMRLAEQIRSRREYPGPVIIFVTALREHMQEAFDVQAYHFLLKPIDDDKFHTVLAGAVAESLKRNRRESIVVKQNGVAHTIPLDDILFVESLRKQIAIHTRTGVLEAYGKIGELAETLEASNMFFRCHRCYIVNMERIAKFSTKTLTITNGQEIFLAREKYQAFVKAYAQYAMLK